MIPPENVELTRCATGAKELGRVTTLTREDARTGIDLKWWNGLDQTFRDPAEEPDRHWEWRAIISHVQNSPYFRSKCVKSADGLIQAAMILRLNAKSALEVGQNAVFVDRLATSPRNRHELVEKPAFRGGGTGLLVYAIAQSYSLGFGGRVNLFPIANDDFYVRIGFKPTTVKAEDDILYEISSRQAVQILSSKGLIDE